MSSHIEVPAQGYRIYFEKIISCGCLITLLMPYYALAGEPVEPWRDKRWMPMTVIILFSHDNFF
jgi:hypothetical protein